VELARYLRQKIGDIALVPCLAILVACQNGTALIPTRELETTPASTPTLKIYAPSGVSPSGITYASPKPIPRTVEEVKKIVEKTPSFLASKHYAEGVQCQSCHNPFPPTTAPTNKACLACHAETYARLVKDTTKISNPHNSHLGEIPCWDCHRGHEPFKPTCLQCHTDAVDCCTIH
jgi:hypothetical protein